MGWPAGAQVRAPARGPDRVPALDGLRGLAVLAVVAFHLWPATVPGGWVGVDVFFVLSGFLITRLLVAELTRTDGIGFGAFWARRARRLLPAALLTSAGVAVAAHWWLDPWRRSGFRGDALASLGYVANWRFIATGNSYFASGARSPLEHLWSLAIEEQFYLVWPLLLLGLWALCRGRRSMVAAATIALAAASAARMAALADATGSRAYFGTDTRAQALLIGAATALLLRERPPARHARPRAGGRGGGGLGGGWVGVARGAVGFAGVPALAALGYVGARVDGADRWLYHWGFGAIALAAALVVAALAAGRPSPVAWVLEWGWLRAAGRISYGLYLWHWPVIVLLTPGRAGFGGARLTALRIASFTVLTLLSYALVEQPIRRSRAAPFRVAVAAVPAMALVLAVIVVGTSGATAPPRQLDSAAGSIQTVPVAATGTTRPGAGAPARIHVGIVGDSVGFTLAYYAGDVPGVDRYGGGTIGCGVVPSANCRNWDDLWRLVGDKHPQLVVVVLGAWEVTDLAIAGGRYEPGTPAARALVLANLEHGLSLFPAGTRVAVLDVPCLELDGSLVPADRIAWINGVFRDFVARHRSRAEIVPISELLCPGGNQNAAVDGIPLRPEGRHFDQRSAPLVWRWLTPRLRELLTDRPG